MAISLNLIEAAGLAKMPGGQQPFLEAPPVNVHMFSAVGRYTFKAGALAYSLKNTGDPVWAKVQLLAGATNAASENAGGDGKSVPLATGDGWDFSLPDDAVPTLWCLDIQAYP